MCGPDTGSQSAGDRGRVTRTGPREKSRRGRYAHDPRQEGEARHKTCRVRRARGRVMVPGRAMADQNRRCRLLRFCCHAAALVRVCLPSGLCVGRRGGEGPHVVCPHAPTGLAVLRPQGACPPRLCVQGLTSSQLRRTCAGLQQRSACIAALLSGRCGGCVHPKSAHIYRPAQPNSASPARLPRRPSPAYPHAPRAPPTSAHFNTPHAMRRSQRRRIRGPVTPRHTAPPAVTPRYGRAAAPAVSGGPRIRKSRAMIR